mgnify:CR=1 FL=1
MIGLVLDIETTGFMKISPITGTLEDSSEILEVAYLRVDMDTLAILDSNTLYFYKDYFQIEGTEAQKVHGLTTAYLQQFADDFEKNLIILNSIIQDTCVIGKNSNKFDIPFIKEFLKKHSNGQLDVEMLVRKNKIKRYGTTNIFFYDAFRNTLDIQTIFKDKFHELYFEKTGIELNARKIGTLSDYIDVIDGGEACVKAIFNGLKNKPREGLYHTAMYDVCATYVVWAYCKMNNLY